MIKMNKKEAKKARQKRMKLSRSKPIDYKVTQQDPDTLKLEFDQLIEAYNEEAKKYLVAQKRCFDMGIMHG